MQGGDATHLELQSLQVRELALVGQDHKGLLATVVCAEFILSASIAVPRYLGACQPRLAGDHLGVLALLADDGDVSGLVLRPHISFVSNVSGA